jgi:hypothetical protein
MNEGADGFTVVGYTICRSCDQHFVDDGKHTRCPRCIRAEVVVGEAEAVTRAAARPPAKRPTRGRRPRKLDVAQKDQKKKWNRARSRALTRLRQIYPEVYEVLLAEEKAALGLDPSLDSRPANVGPLERELVRSA